ncbi:MAG: sulfatase-like hydrolase/transferase [Candidatus Binatia bacterium]
MISTRPFALIGLGLFAAVALVSPSHAKKPPTPPGKPPGNHHQPPGKSRTPNILFVVMDDVGIDQMKTFGYGGDSPPSTPTIERIADAGVVFRNTWAMPACTTSRAVAFTARFPFRTNVLGALGPDDLANSMVSPYEMTTPKLLATRGYESALFGKFHITLQGKDPAGLAGPHALGWNYFAGWMDETGDPHSIDTTAGGVATDGKQYSCGFVPSAAAGGADSGACYTADGSCHELTGNGSVPPGRICRDTGGVLDPDKSCGPAVPAYIDFTRQSGHYVSPLVINQPNGSVEEVPPTDLRSRRFRAGFVVDAAADWINSRPAGEPWMATVSFASDHTPLMQPPFDSKLPGGAGSSDVDCASPAVQQQLSNLMIESMDAEIGRLLLKTGLARLGNNGELVYRPHATDTMVIVIGDNGSLGATVKTPFDVIRSKGTAYQTGVWVPLLVSGPLMKGPSRSVPHMVNVADLYSLFGEIAGIDDVQAEVARPIDAEPMLPYIVKPKQRAIRKFNFTQVGANLQPGGRINGPCTIGGTCTQIPVSKGVCEDNGGTWWGPMHDAEITRDAPVDGFAYCCEVNQHVVAKGCTPGTLGCPYGITPLDSVGIRNKRYKIVKNSVNQYFDQENFCVETPTIEFFEIDEAVPVPKLDQAGKQLPLDALTRRQQRNYDALSSRLEALLASEPECPGDGNIDYVVDQGDLDGWALYSGTPNQSSVFDLNLDGTTDEHDEEIIQTHLGSDCRLP